MRRILKAPSPTDGVDDAEPSPCDPATLAQLTAAFNDCKGNVVRVHEVLAERHQLQVPYSTLTRWVRDAGLRAPLRRSGTYDFEPGAETQHDTSPHRLRIGERTLTAQCAALTLAYSRRLFIRYYPCFTRFEAKAFLAEAFDYMGGTCARCVIDNTSVLVASGAGPDAIIAPQMRAFAHAYGVRFVPHRVNHPDRKARIERPFAWVEGNFLAGRSFDSWGDLNAQALAWCNTVATVKHKRRLGMSPDAAWVLERPHLISLPAHCPPVYETYERVVDVVGFVNLDTNRYSVPERFVGRQLTVTKHPDEVCVHLRQRLLATHPRLLDVRDTRHTLPGHHTVPGRHGKRRDPSEEEAALRGSDAQLDAYIDALKPRLHGRGQRAMRQLLELRRTYPAQPFASAIDTAAQYGLYDLERLEQLILKHVAGDFFAIDHGNEDDDPKDDE